MAGLLDDLFNSESGQIGLGLLAAGSARSDGAGFGQRLQEGLGAGARWKKEQQALAEAKQMQEFRAMQMEQMQAAQRQSGIDADAVRAAFSPMSGGAAMANGQGPTIENAENIGKVSPFNPQQFFAQNPQASIAALKTAMETNQALNPKKKFGFQVVDGNLVRTDEEGGASPVFKAGPKPLDPNKPFYLSEDGKVLPNEPFQAFDLKSKTAGAPKVAVNMNDPTAVAKAAMAFQNDYRAATKDSFQRAQAYESMLQATKDPSAKGDLTMVYSFIKALDPTSVVREGEISLVEANRSIPDRIKGYAKKLATGQSLLPSERQDLLTQAKTLTQTDYRRSRNDVKAYRDNAKRLQLDPETYAPDPYKAFEESTKKTVVKTGMYGGRKVVQYDDGSTDYAD